MREDLISAVVYILVSAILGWILGSEHERKSFQNEAVIEGHAVWTADENGRAVWKWKELRYEQE